MFWNALLSAITGAALLAIGLAANTPEGKVLSVKPSAEAKDAGHEYIEPLPCFIPLTNWSLTDADTLRADVLLPFGVTLQGESIRCAGYDAFEISSRRFKVGPAEIEAGHKATRMLRQLMMRSHAVYVHPVTLERDSRGRLLGRLVLQDGDGKFIDVAEWAEANKHVRIPNSEAEKLR